MTDDALPPSPFGGRFDLTAGFGDSQKEQFETLLVSARANPQEAEKLCRHAAALAREWQEKESYLLAMNELAEVFAVQGKTEDELYALREIAEFCSQSVKQDARLINVDKKIGICYARLRRPDQAIQYLRAAVVRCQSSTDDSLIDEFVDCLCTLSSVYRQKDWFDRARTCIKQAYAIVVEEENRLDLQARVLEELARVTLAQHRAREAAAAFIRVLKLKLEAFGPLHSGLAETFAALGMCYLDLDEFENAESAFIQALECMRQCGSSSDRIEHSNALNRLAGVYRKQARFLEASLLEQGASEILGRATELRLAYFKEFDAGTKAHENKHFDMALNCYRQSLVRLEGIFDKHAFIRVPILCRVAEIAAERKQKLQYRSLLIEIEEGLELLGGKERGDLCGRLLELARLFRLLSFDAFSNSCYRFAGSLQRQKPDGRQASIMAEHLSLIELMEASSEAMRLKKYLRRACKVLGGAAPAPQPGYLLSDRGKLVESGTEFEIDAEIVG